MRPTTRTDVTRRPAGAVAVVDTRVEALISGLLLLVLLLL